MRIIHKWSLKLCLFILHCVKKWSDLKDEEELVYRKLKRTKGETDEDEVMSTMMLNMIKDKKWH